MKLGLKGYKLIFIALVTSSTALLAQTSIEETLRRTTKKTYDMNCFSLVEKIREDTRNRISVLEVSIEQIYDQYEISISARKVECSGEALLSNSGRYQIKYGAAIDANGEWILSYSLPDQ